jgi:PAS domain S-box-containing protein
MASLLFHYQFSPYTWVHIAAAVVGIFVVIVICRRFSQVSARFLTIMELCVIEWTVASIFEVAATTVPLKVLWSQIGYVGTVSTPLFYFLFIMLYSQHDQVVTPRRIALLSVIPALTLAVTATNSLHHWLWTDITINPASNIAVYSHGFWFWINIGYAYIIVLTGFVTLCFSIMRFSGFYKAQIGMLLFGTALPVVANVVYIVELLPVPGLELTPVSFMLSGLFITISMVRFRMFDLVPVARKKLVDIMGDGVIVIDAGGRIVDLNPAMETILRMTAEQIIGQPADQVFSRWGEVREALKEEKEERFVASFGEGKGNRFFDLYLSIVKSPQKEYAGRIIVFRDITKRRRMEIEREGLISELQETLDQVKTLSGLLPICANCKKIRDDKGYWKDVETYINEHSDATFTHGICPDCMKKLYPEYNVGEDEGKHSS